MSFKHYHFDTTGFTVTEGCHSLDLTCERVDCQHTFHFGDKAEPVEINAELRSHRALHLFNRIVAVVDDTPMIQCAIIGVMAARLGTNPDVESHRMFRKPLKDLTAEQRTRLKNDLVRRAGERGPGYKTPADRYAESNARFGRKE